MLKISYVRNLKTYLIISAALFAVILLGLCIFGVTLDISFSGGSIITYSYDGDIELTDFQDVAAQVTGSDVSAQKSENIVTGQQTIVISLPGNLSLTVEEMSAVTDSLREGFPDNNVQTMEIVNVDPTLGGEFLVKCLLAMAFAFLLMIIYVGFSFRKIGGVSAGVCAVFALVHDIVIAFGVFVLFRIPLDDNFIVVVLTILGFSLNDTIVIYDRIRENQRIMPRGTNLSDLTDLSINQTFKRTTLTAAMGIMALVVVSIVAFIFKVNTIQSFAFPLILGMISGSYSSICLNGPIWVWWQNQKRKRATAA